MQAAQKCRNCGATVAGDAPFGHCPQCLISLGFASRPSELPAEAGFVRRSGKGLGDYELISQIGRGGMGVVYRARQKSLGRIVALKMIRDEQVVSPVFLKRFQIEAEAAASLDHPHIVPIYEIGEEQGQHFYSMRLMEGGSLEERITPTGFVPASDATPGERVRQERIARLIARAARAVHYAHKKGVVHRDLKPSNILLDEGGHPHLSDFGIAKSQDAHAKLTMTGALLGTPGYMAPEQATGEAHLLSPAADIYSLGAILYEMLIGQPPFSGVTPVETLHRLTTENPKKPTSLNSSINRDLENICLKCLEKSPAQRYSSAEALAEDLERWLRHEPIRAKRAGPLLRAQRWMRRNPVGTALIATLCIGLASALVLLEMVRQAREAAERGQNALLLDLKMEQFWTSPEQSEKLSSEKLAAIIGRKGRGTGGAEPKRYRMGFLVEAEPGVKVNKFAHIIGHLEEDLSHRLSSPIRLDLWVYKRNKEAVDDLVQSRLDFLRIGGVSYLEARALSPGISPIAAQAPPKWGVIFAPSNSPIQSVAELRGHSFAFGESYATISFWAKYYLAGQGVGAAELRHYEVLDTVSAFEESIRAGKVDLGPGRVLNSHTEVVKAVVIEERFDAGVASEGQLRELLFTKKIRELKRFQSTSLFWLAREGLPTSLVREIRRGLIEFPDPAMLQAFGGLQTRFVPVPAGELEAIEAATKVVEQYFPEAISRTSPPDASQTR